MKVKIKTWEGMEKEFGLNQYGSIHCKHGFTDEMEKLIPEDRIIDVEPTGKEYPKYQWDTPNRVFWVSDEMIEERIEE